MIFNTFILYGLTHFYLNIFILTINEFELIE